MKEVSIALEKPRVVIITDKGKLFTYRFRPLSGSDWRTFFAGIVNQTEERDGAREQVFDLRTALQVLVEESLLSVEGYSTPGGIPLEQIPNWKNKLPIGHKLTAGAVLKDVKVSDSPTDDGSMLLSETTDVVLECLWTADEESRTMTRIGGLVHRFLQPSIEQLRRFNRESSRSRVVGGSRTGKTIWPGTQTLLAHMYDDLIVSVDGYTFNGTALANQKDAIKQSMDMYHKAAAVERLFAPPEDSVAAAE